MRTRLVLVLAFVPFLFALGNGAEQLATDEVQARAKSVLAQLDGEIALPGLKQRVEVLRDRWGVPHIYASDQGDLFFAQGFVAAQDRLFQMDLWRRANQGELSELLGRKQLEGDLFARVLLYRGNMDAEWRSYHPDAKAIATAFAAGVNACIDHLGDRMGDKLPIEFQLLNYRPRRWRPEDCLGRLTGLAMSRNFQQEVSRAELLQAVGLEKAQRLAPTDPLRAFKPLTDLDGVERSILSGYHTAIRPLTLSSAQPGSNNWAVDGSRSRSGKPLLASDPHRALTLPSLRYLSHLHAPGWHVIGAGEPSLPGISLGHNDHVAWGFTIVGTDQADIVIEELHPQDDLRFRVNDDWAPMRAIKEHVNVLGEPKPVEVELRFTRHGPVIHQDLKRRRAYVLRFAGSEPGAAAYLGALSLSTARNAMEFLQAMPAWKLPAENMVYADVDGNIGWIAAGLAPIRKNHDGLLPVPGANNEFVWHGFLPTAELPQSLNPPSHTLATANHNILPTGYPHTLSYDWALPFRMARVKAGLDAKPRFDLDDFKNLQLDCVSIPGQRLARLARLLGTRDAELQPYVDLLARWDGNLTKDSPAGGLYAVWLQELLAGFYKPHVPDKLLSFVRSGRGVQVLLTALEDPQRDWFGEFPVTARNELLRKSLANAVQRLHKLQPGEPARWAWGRQHQAIFRHQIGVLSPNHARQFDLAPVPRPGDGHTPHAAAFNERYEQISGATYRQLFDLADWDKGLATSAPGQSGQPGSPHYADLLPLWAEGEYFPLAFSRAKVEEVKKHRLVLRPR
jgi:penicillin amidase